MRFSPCNASLIDRSRPCTFPPQSIFRAAWMGIIPLPQVAFPGPKRMRHGTVGESPCERVSAGLRGIVPDCQSDWRAADFPGPDPRLHPAGTQHACAFGRAQQFRSALGLAVRRFVCPRVLWHHLADRACRRRVVVAATGWNLLQAQNSASGERAGHPAVAPTDAFYPLTMPITVGPGSMAVAITLRAIAP